jgi:hypothetical protein
MTSASAVKKVVLRADVQNRGSDSTCSKLSSPTQTGSVTRLVCWKLMTTARAMGNQAKYPKVRSSGSNSTNVLRPPLRTHRFTAFARVPLRPFTTSLRAGVRPARR